MSLFNRRDTALLGGWGSCCVEGVLCGRMNEVSFLHDHAMEDPFGLKDIVIVVLYYLHQRRC